MQSNPAWRKVAGILVVLAGIALIPLPGPGLPLVFAGLAMLGWSPREAGAWLPASVRGRLPGPTPAVG